MKQKEPVRSPPPAQGGGGGTEGGVLRPRGSMSQVSPAGEMAPVGGRDLQVKDRGVFVLLPRPLALTAAAGT